MIVLAKPLSYIQSNKKELLADPSVAIISILNTDIEQAAQVPYPHLTMRFDDICPSSVGQAGYDLQPMLSHQASQVLFFVDDILDEYIKYPVDTILVHCSAGISRSGAVASFINEYLKLDHVEFTRNNPQIIPNLWVKDLLWATAIHNERVEDATLV